MAEKGKKRCSFCGRTEDQVALLMTGMTGYICNDCVEQAHNILREESLLPKSDFKMTELPKPKEIKEIAFLQCDDTRAALAHLWHAWYGFPCQGLKIIGVTGTNGKTSVAHMLRTILRSSWRTCGIIGTVGC